jgi:hypothetical protein
VLGEELPTDGLVIEIASGSGEHAVHFARTFPRLQWQPSDPDPAARASIAAWEAEERLPNLLPPLALDADAPDWSVARADAVLCINMVHISPVEASEGLAAGAARLLSPGAPLILYGPYLEDDIEPAPSNLAFDADLKTRDPRWGLRPVAWIDDLAWRHGFGRTRRAEMPANNLMLVYRRTA